MSRILKVGFELEGGWKGDPGISPFTDISLIADHSVNGQTLLGGALRAPHVGEAVSPPINFEEAGDDVGTHKWELWLLSHWPNADPPNRTNNTCGFHIHTSFASLRDYALLTSKTFAFSLKEQLLQLGKELRLPPKHLFWSRMEGKNTFCTLLYDPAPQMELRQKDGVQRVRYGWLNFAYRVHGTMEFRALPTFRDAAVGVRFATTYFNFIESWLEEKKDLVLERERKF
jgi:hypothetical protein